jgi:hypothetical protein
MTQPHREVDACVSCECVRPFDHSLEASRAVRTQSFRSQLHPLFDELLLQRHFAGAQNHRSGAASIRLVLMLYNIRIVFAALALTVRCPCITFAPG